jgi:hypothetical protein
MRSSGGEFLDDKMKSILTTPYLGLQAIIDSQRMTASGIMGGF